MLKTSETALLLIDLQNGFYHPDSAMGKTHDLSGRQKTIETIAAVVRWARSKHIPLFWSQQVHFPEDVTRQRRQLRAHTDKQRFTPCLRGSFETELFAPAKALLAPADYVIEKHRASLFFETNLAVKLKMLGVKNLIVTGCNTEFCVAHTVRDAYARDFDVVVVRDAVDGIDPVLHQQGLEMLAAYFAEVRPAAALAELFHE